MSTANEIDPTTGWPLAFEASVRLGHAANMFALYTHTDQTVWVCTLLRSRGRKHGRGSKGKRCWREWWQPVAKLDVAAGVHTDWFSHGPAKRAVSLGLPVYIAGRVPDNVHIVWDDQADGSGEKT